MSHFTCTVITKETPTPDLLEKVLLPYHEFECTGIEAVDPNDWISIVDCHI